MKKLFIAALALTCGLFFCAPEVSAQNDPAQCRGCKHAVPGEVLLSTKNAVTISGPPDSKGDPVEYQIFSQARLGAKWKLEAAGVVDKPGVKETFKYYKPAQLMVLVYCGTPFGSMVEFSTAKVTAPSTSNDVIAPSPVRN